MDVSTCIENVAMAHTCEPKPFHQDSFDTMFSSKELIFNEDSCKPFNIRHLINDLCRLREEATERKIEQCVERYIHDTENQVLHHCFNNTKEYLIWLLHQQLLCESDWKCTEKIIVEALEQTTVDCIRIKSTGCCYSAFKMTFKSQAYVGSLYKELWTLLSNSSLVQAFVAKSLTVEDVIAIIYFFKDNFKHTQTAKDIVKLFASTCRELEKYTLSEFARGRSLVNIFNSCCEHKSVHYEHCLEDTSLC